MGGPLTVENVRSAARFIAQTRAEFPDVADGLLRALQTKVLMAVAEGHSRPVDLAKVALSG